MIKNVIFDMGKVLIDFNPECFIRHIGVSNEDDIKILVREVYKSVEWSMMDRGSLSDKQACEIMVQRIPEHLRQYVPKLTYEWDRPILPIKGAEKLIRELKSKRYNLYLLSNASMHQKTYWPQIPGNECFDGTVVSSYVGLVKPQPEIYKHLLNKFNLNPEECVFIDDSTLNIEAAIYCGLKGIVFHDDYKEVRTKLISLGVSVAEE